MSLAWLLHGGQHVLMLRRKSKNINSPIPSVASLLCLHSWHSPICCTHFIPAHLRQRYTASQLPAAVRTVLWHYIFSLQENWARLSWVIYSAFPIVDCRNYFLWEEAFRLGCLRTTRVTHTMLCCVNCTNTIQNHTVKFQASSDVWSQSKFSLKKNDYNSFKSGNASEE